MAGTARSHRIELWVGLGMTTDDAILRRLTQIEQRLERMEEWRQVATTQAAIVARDAQYSKERFDALERQLVELNIRIEKDLSELKAVAWRVVWIVATAFLTSGVAWVVQGGLRLG